MKNFTYDLGLFRNNNQYPIRSFGATPKLSVAENCLPAAHACSNAKFKRKMLSALSFTFMVSISSIFAYKPIFICFHFLICVNISTVSRPNRLNDFTRTKSNSLFFPSRII